MSGSQDFLCATRVLHLPFRSKSPDDLWDKYRSWKGLTPEAEQIVLQDYFDDGSGKAPRYYQANAINAAIEAIAKGRDRILLVMATGTGKTYWDSRRLPVSFSGHNLAEWRRQGQEADSLVADPQFARRELRFTPLLGSPVWKLGWKKIDTTTIGPRVSPGLSASLMH